MADAFYLKNLGTEMRDLLQKGGAIKDTDFVAKRGVPLSNLRQVLQVHRQVPMGLGSANKGFDQVVRALIQKLQLEFSHDVTPLLQRIMGLCVDLGEIELPDVSVTVGSCTPDWSSARPSSIQVDSTDESSWPLLRLSPGLSEYLFPFCLPSPGLGHIWSNLMFDIDHTLSGAEEWLRRWQALSPLLTKPYLHKRFMGTCVLGGPFHSLRGSLEGSLMPNLPTWRWGAIFDILDRLLPLQGPLRATWSAESFAARPLPASIENEIDRDATEAHVRALNLPLITEIITTDWFWMYGRMLLMLHQVGDSFRPRMV